MYQLVLFYCVTPDMLIGWHGARVMYFVVDSVWWCQYPHAAYEEI